jgi:hypothetical protein
MDSILNDVISNKHLSKIILEYVNTEIIYKTELLYRTIDLYKDNCYWYTYDKYCICFEENGVHNGRDIIDGHYYYRFQNKLKCWYVDFKLI